MTEAKPPDSSFKTRVRSALIFGPLVLLVLWFGGGGFAVMMALAAGIGVQEWSRMVLTGKQAPAQLVNLAAVLGGIGAFSAQLAENPVTSLVFLLALCFLIFCYNTAQKGPSIWLLLFGVIYIGFSCAIMIWLRAGSSAQGLYNFTTLLFIVWGSDVCAYLSGKSIGGPKLAPKISPKKTWAGFIGSSVGAGAIAAGLACPALTQKLGVDTLGGLGPFGYAAMAFILAMFGQAGDLFISMFKRHFGVKDTGTLIPGHGGILDRIDALLLVAYLFGSIAMVLA